MRASWTERASWTRWASERSPTDTWACRWQLPKLVTWPLIATGVAFFPSAYRTLVYNSWWLSIRPDIDVNMALLIPFPCVPSRLFSIDFHRTKVGARYYVLSPKRLCALGVIVARVCAERAHCSISARRRAAWLGHPSRASPRPAAAPATLDLRPSPQGPVSLAREPATRATQTEAYF